MLKFHQIVTQKSIQTGMFILLLLILNSVHIIKGGEPPDLTFIVKDSNGIEPVCFADGNVLNSAIGWIYPVVDTKDKLPKSDAQQGWMAMDLWHRKEELARFIDIWFTTLIVINNRDMRERFHLFSDSTILEYNRKRLFHIVTTYIPDLKNDYDCNFSKTTHCNSGWQMENWQYSKFSSHNFKPTLDTRWEGFPTLLTSNNTKEFISKTEITPTFHIGISIRAAKNAEMFVCEGWDPHNYPCYYVNIGGSDNRQAFLRKYKIVPEKFSKNDTKLSKYKTEVGILHEEEWKNFALTLNENGEIKLSDVNKNLTLLNYTDKVPFHPNYLFIRSKYENALWKIHNNQYIFTNKTGITQLGPTFGIYGSDLCVSLYVSLCNNCKMSFFLMENGERIVLKEVLNENNQEDLAWNEIKLIQHNILDDKINLFVETKYTNKNTLRNGFWAIDDVRICAEHEIKMTQLLIRTDLNESEKLQLSCQALSFPSWRPLQHVSSSSTEEMKYNSSTPTSLRLSWKFTSAADNLYQEYYVVQYEGKDICTRNDASNSIQQNKNRQKSQGYIVGTSNNVLIEKLVPYTNYNITFWSPLRGKKTSYQVNTLPTDKPTKEELPKNFITKATDKTVQMEWDSPKCNETYGPLMYQISVKSQDNSDRRFLTDIKTKYKLENLLSFMNYSVDIRTGRKLEYLNDSYLSIRTIFNFTTLPGVAPKVRNLEVYAIDKHSASLRFDLPESLKGLPKYVQVQWCHPLYIDGCSPDTSNLTKCKLWDNKYCVDIENLILSSNYTFLVSLKNDKTYVFGDEVAVTGKTVDKVPGKPSNITYKMIDCSQKRDYCHLNISWIHPYNQNGTITMFDIILNETSYTFVTDTLKSIHEVLIVPNKEYQSMYYHIVKYIPFNTPYKIAIRAVNDAYKGSFASINIKTEHIANYLDQTPTFIKNTNDTIIYQLPKLDWRLNSSTLIVVVQDYDSSKDHISEDIINLETFDDENQLCNEFGETWIAKIVNITDPTPLNVIIGDGTSSYSPQLNKPVVNKALQPDTDYCITFTLVNKYRDSETLAVYHEKHIFTQPSSRIAFPHREDEPVESTNVAAYVVPILFIILLLVCGAWLTYRYFKKKGRNIDGDHIYESMPFDDYLPDAVSNQSYDKLVHS